MPISDETIQKFKELYERKYGQKLTDGEAELEAMNLVGLVEIFIKLDITEHERQSRLKDEPKGFHLTDGTYSCAICGTYVTGDSSWYDKFGIKCMTCQHAVDQHIIPGSLCYKDTWYKMWELEQYYNLKSPTVRKLVRDGKLKARIILRENGRPYFYIFIIKENQGVLHKKHKAIFKKEDNRYTSVRYPKLTLGEQKNVSDL